MAKERELKEIEVREITMNPDNPRGQDVAGSDDAFWYLVESVKDFGVLVPLLVRPIDDQGYQLIDGERRLLAAKQLALKTVPAYVMHEALDKETIQKTMFQIHHGRRGWDAPAECRALEPFYAELIKEHGRADEEVLVKELVKRTGMNKRTAHDRLQFLRWPEAIKWQIYKGETKAPYWFIVELEDKIIEPAIDNFPEYFDRVPADEVRRLLFRKWEQKVVGAAENVRSAGIIARYKAPEDHRKEAEEIFKRLVKDETLGFEEARQEFLARFPDAEEPRPMGPRAIYNALLRLTELLNGYDERYVVEGLGRSKVAPGIFVAALDALIGAAQRFMHRVGEYLD